ncbi:MAG: hypothetical protein AAB308_12390 [Nitrospirota bacterium]
MFGRDLGRLNFAEIKLWDLVGTSARARRNSLKPDTTFPSDGIELWALISMAVEFKPMLKQGNGKIHLPESLKEVIACILPEMDIGKRVKLSPERLNKVFVSDTEWMISRITVSQVFTRSIHKEGDGWR